MLDCQGLVKSALVAFQARRASSGFRASFGNRSQECGYDWPVRYLVNRRRTMPERIRAVARMRSMPALALGYSVQSPALYSLKPSPVEVASLRPAVVLDHDTTRPDNQWPQENWVRIGLHEAWGFSNVTVGLFIFIEETFAMLSAKRSCFVRKRIQ